MAEALIIAGVFAVVAGWQYAYGFHRTAGRLWRPLWCAFTLTFFGLIHLGPALFGYNVPFHNPVIEARVTWVGHVVWSQVQFGGWLALLSGPFWWFGLRDLRRA